MKTGFRIRCKNKIHVCTQVKLESLLQKINYLKFINSLLIVSIQIINKAIINIGEICAEKYCLTLIKQFILKIITVSTKAGRKAKVSYIIEMSTLILKYRK